MCLKLFHQRIYHFFAVLGFHLRHARLAVNAQTQLHVARFDTLFFFIFAAARQAATGHRHAHAGSGINRLLRDFGNVFQGFPLLGRITGDFVHQHRTGDTARLFVVRQGDIVGDHDQFDVVPHTFGFLRRQPEVQPVAGVVFDDQQTARFTGHRHNRVQHRIDARRGKHFAADRGGEHSFADKSDVRRFVARAAAGDQRDLFLIPVAAHHNADSRIDVQLRQIFVGRGQDHPFDNIVNQSLAVIHEKFRHAGRFLLTVFQVF